MPYAANVYSVPPGTAATTLTQIDSSDYNAFVADIEAAQNAARPIVAGGTGAVTADLALTALGLTTAGKAIVTAATYAAIRALLDLEAGTDFYSKAATDAGFQPLDADLTALASAFAAASASGPASLKLAEDTDNGSHFARLIAPAALSGDIDLTLPTSAGTLALAGDGWTTILKSADVSNTSNTTLASDADLQFSMLANTTYRISIFVEFEETVSQNNDLKFALTGPASPTLVRGRYSGFAGNASTETVGHFSGYLGSTTLDGGIGAGCVELELIVQNGANAGTFAFQWAPAGNTGGGGVTVRKGSSLEYMSI